MISFSSLLPTDPSSLKRVATYASIGVASTLIAAKLFAYIMTGSVSLLSSLLDSTVDLVASFVTLYGVISAMQPPDKEHRFGHGKAESLAALAQGGFVFGSALLLCNEAVSRFFNPAPVQNSTIGYGVMVFSILVTIALIRFQQKVVAQTQSAAIGADRLHYTGDVLINGSVIISILLQQFFKVDWIDPLFALAIAGILMRGAWKIGMDALHVLMDRELPEEDRTQIHSLAIGTPGVEGVHDLRTRSDSGRIFIEIHIEMDPALSLKKAHDIAELATARLQNAYLTADVIVHMDPSGHEEPRLDVLIEEKTA